MTFAGIWTWSTSRLSTSNDADLPPAMTRLSSRLMYLPKTKMSAMLVVPPLMVYVAVVGGVVSDVTLNVAGGGDAVVAVELLVDAAEPPEDEAGAVITSTPEYPVSSGTRAVAPSENRSNPLALFSNGS